MFRYALVEGDFWLPDIGPYHSFGLQVGSLERGAYTVLTAVQDISTDREFVQSLARQFTACQLMSRPGLFQALCPEGLFAVRFFASHHCNTAIPCAQASVMI